MFSKSQNNTSMKDENRGIPNINMISQGTEITGTLKTNTDIRISGTINGTLESKGKIIISAGGNIHGDVHAKEADIAGTINGELIVSDKLILRQSAVISGDITTKSLLVEEGARFDGACKMSTPINSDHSLNGKSQTGAQKSHAK